MTTTIEWAHAGLGRGETWNPIRARHKATGKIGWHCEKVSPACEHCYAERQNMAGARGGTKLPYKPGHRRDVEIYLDEKTLFAPLHWKTPRGIFAGSMTDLFAEFVPDEWLDKIFAVAALCPQHIFIFLTKRPARMREYMSDLRRPHKIARACIDLLVEKKISTKTLNDRWPIESIGDIDMPDDITLRQWPLPNVWLGVTAEDQQRADERIPELLATPATTRFISCEPLLGWIGLYNLPLGKSGHVNALTGETLSFDGDYDTGGPRLDLVIAGGESGPGARPIHIDWERSILDQCAATGVAYFRKQAGEWLHESQDIGPVSNWRSSTHEWPDGTKSYRVGKRRAGRMLDGVEHNEFPEPQRNRS